MTNRVAAICKMGLLLLLLSIVSEHTKAQYKDFKISANGDTINIVDKKGLKQGKWVSSVGEIRGEPGYDEEGSYKNDKKTGIWRKYNSNGDIIAVENYMDGGKDGLQQYFTFLGVLVKEEEWKGFNPDKPYDTIPVYGTGSNEVVDFKIVKAEQYSVPNGEWRYFDPGTGRLIKIEKYDRGRLLKDEPDKAPAAATADKPKEKVKPPAVLEYEKKYSKKKRQEMERDGKTGL